MVRLTFAVIICIEDLLKQYFAAVQISIILCELPLTLIWGENDLSPRFADTGANEVG